jgi:ribonuclease HIII
MWNRVAMAERTSYTCLLDADKIPQLKRDLEARGYDFREVPYAHFGAMSDSEKVNVAIYTSGKLVIQGKGTTDFIQFYLEPQLLGEARLGYEHILDPTMLEPRIGVDESGKGDFFGPLVIAGAFLNEAAARNMMEIGVKDSKLIKSDARIAEVAKQIRATPGCVTDVVAIGPEKYNELHARMRNVNDILGWGHARVIENLLARVDSPKAISDQFGNKRIIEKALMERGRKIQLVQRHKAAMGLCCDCAHSVRNTASCCPKARRRRSRKPAFNSSRSTEATYWAKWPRRISARHRRFWKERQNERDDRTRGGFVDRVRGFDRDETVQGEYRLLGTGLP